MPSFLKKCLTCIPQRWIVAFMGFCAFFNAYTLRICLSIAITKMSAPLNHTQESIDETCPDFIDDKNITLTSIGESHREFFEWDEYTQGIILSSFYWGYVITHFPAGVIADKFGPKYTLGIGILLASILTVITPAATFWGDWSALIVVRFLLGLCEGVIQPSISTLFSHWIPANERSFMSSFVYTGIKLGMLISTVSSGLIMGRSSSDWPFIFHLFGGIGILWFLFWILLCYNNPNEHPFITEKERTFLNEHMKSHHKHENKAPFPWKSAFTSKPFLALVIAQCAHDWGFYTIMSDLPKYMANVLKLPVHLNGYASSMYNITSWVFTWTISWFSDWMISKNYVSITNIRKINTSISGFGPGIFIILAMYSGCNVISAITLITVGLTSSGSAIPGIKVNVLDLSPNYAGTLMGISNGIGAIAGILAPYTVGVLAYNQTLSEWKLIFWIVLFINTVATVTFIIFGSGEVQEWNNLKVSCDDKSKEQDKEEAVNLVPTKHSSE